MKKCHRLSGLNNKDLFLTILEVKKSTFKVLEDSVSGESWLPGSQMAVLLCPHLAKGAGELCGIFFKRAQISFMRALPS